VIFGGKSRDHVASLFRGHHSTLALSLLAYKARRTWWNKTEIKHWNCFSLISIFFNTAKLFQCFSFRDVRTSEIKLSLNNAAGGRLYFTRPHIPETETKQNCRRSAETKPPPSPVLFYFSFISPCATGLIENSKTSKREKVSDKLFYGNCPLSYLVSKAHSIQFIRLVVLLIYYLQCWSILVFLYLSYPVILRQLSVLLLIAFLSSEHISFLLPILASFCSCVFLELK